MRLEKMGDDYFLIMKENKTFATVDFRNKGNPMISVNSTISLWDLRGVMYHIEEFVKQVK